MTSKQLTAVLLSSIFISIGSDALAETLETTAPVESNDSVASSEHDTAKNKPADTKTSAEIQAALDRLDNMLEKLESQLDEAEDKAGDDDKYDDLEDEIDDLEEEIKDLEDKLPENEGDAVSEETAEEAKKIEADAAKIATKVEAAIKAPQKNDADESSADAKPGMFAKIKTKVMSWFS